MRISAAVGYALLLVIVISGLSSAQWLESGTVICEHTGNQRFHVMSSDSMGGALFSWMDYRHGDSNIDIYAQRIDGDGCVLWDSAGAEVCGAPGNQYYAIVRSDGKGGGIVVWQDGRSGAYDIYAQRIRHDGTPAWLADGIQVCTAAGDQLDPAIVPDSEGGAIIVWRDHRDGYVDFYAQRVDSSGVGLWADGGVKFCASGVTELEYSYGLPVPAPDGSGGAIVVWRDRRYVYHYVYAQRIDGHGNSLWTENVVKLTTNMTDNEEGDCSLAPDGTGGAVFVWLVEGEEMSSRHDLYAQRVRADGAIAWDPAGVGVCVSPDWWCSDGSATVIDRDNILIVWFDVRPSTGGVFTQKLDSLGTAQWVENGLSVCDYPSTHGSPRTVVDGEGGVVIAWFDDRSTQGIFAQRLNADGDRLWTPEGVNVYLQDEWKDMGGPLMVTDGIGGGLISWVERRDGYNYWIYAKRIMIDGEVPVPTFLQEHHIRLEEGRILLEWTISGASADGIFSIFRQPSGVETFAEASRFSVIPGILQYEYLDESCEPGAEYRYRVVYEEGQQSHILFETGLLGVPALPLTLYQNRPNPFNPSTTIEYYLPERIPVSLDVYDVGGRHIVRLANGMHESGLHTIAWNGLDAAGRAVAGGVYFYSLRAGKRVLTRKMIILR
ncbi:MAG: FlgD immunoglobulin-like domain containing protein [Candidatus Krumholzibacteria bacterium]|nr:FlgD immunoglobulin-like domain containing protein [Candidatus Krumholzibacteria bacterium]